MSDSALIALQSGDALIVVDIQNDFLPGGSLAVPEGDQVIPILNEYIRRFYTVVLPIYITRDWHPGDHCSFQAQGGPWPPHCVVDTHGARFSSALEIPAEAVIISKATRPEKEAYSGGHGPAGALARTSSTAPVYRWTRHRLLCAVHGA
jgi:nicotinamidase/pyrazinamidase